VHLEVEVDLLLVVVGVEVLPFLVEVVEVEVLPFLLVGEVVVEVLQNLVVGEVGVVVLLLLLLLTQKVVGVVEEGVNLLGLILLLFLFCNFIC